MTLMTREHLLLTVLGTNPRVVRYSLGEREVEAPLAPAALFELLPHEDRPNRVLAICTWQAANDSWPRLEQALRGWCGVERVDVPAGDAQSDVNEYVKRVTDAVPDDVDLTVDVTHGYRHFSFLTYIALSTPSASETLSVSAPCSISGATSTSPRHTGRCCAPASTTSCPARRPRLPARRRTRSAADRRAIGRPRRSGGRTAAGRTDVQRVDVHSLRLVRPRRVGVEQVGLWALEQLGLPALLADLGVNGPFARRRPGPSSGAWPSRVQRQLLLPLGVSHICRFRSSWIEINNDDACGPCGRRLRRPKRGGKRAASSRYGCTRVRARFPPRWRGPQAVRLPDYPGVHEVDRRRARGSSGPGARPRGAGAGGDVRRDRSVR